MTREEAIQALNEIFDDSEFSRYESWYGTAMDMAIEALSADGSLTVIREQIEKHPYLEFAEVVRCKDCKEYDTENYCCHRWSKVIRNTVEELKNDRPHGEWKHTITWQPYCSNCEYVFGEDEEFSSLWNYCPMCGARMENKE